MPIETWANSGIGTTLIDKSKLFETRTSPPVYCAIESSNITGPSSDQEGTFALATNYHLFCICISFELCVAHKNKQIRNIQQTKKPPYFVAIQNAKGINFNPKLELCCGGFRSVNWFFRCSLKTLNLNFKT